MRVGFFLFMFLCYIPESPESSSINLDSWWSELTQAIFSETNTLI